MYAPVQNQAPMMMPNGMGVPMNPNMMHGPATVMALFSSKHKHRDEGGEA